MRQCWLGGFTEGAKKPYALAPGAIFVRREGAIVLAESRQDHRARAGREQPAGITGLQPRPAASAAQLAS